MLLDLHDPSTTSKTTPWLLLTGHPAKRHFTAATLEKSTHVIRVGTHLEEKSKFNTSIFPLSFRIPKVLSPSLLLALIALAAQEECVFWRYQASLRVLSSGPESAELPPSSSLLSHQLRVVGFVPPRTYPSKRTGQWRSAHLQSWATVITLIVAFFPHLKQKLVSFDSCL